MASIKRYKGKWRAEVNRRGIRRAKAFDTRQEAADWAAKLESEIMGGAKIAARTLFGEVMERYARDVSPTKRGERWEILQLRRMRKDVIAGIRMSDLRASDFADWRDRRLQSVAPGTVRREMVLMSAMLNTARREWGLLDKNPMEGVKRPPEPPPRKRLPTEDELERLRHVAGEGLETGRARAVHAFFFAIETGMRAGEIVGLTWERIDLERRVAHLPETKNGDARDVPLSGEAVRLLQALPDGRNVFGLSSGQLDALWRSVRARAGIEGLRFHDSRAEAITRLSKRLDPLSLARMIGHRNINQLMTYYRESAEDIARRL